MGLYQMGASSSANRETRILKLKAYINTVKTYNSLEALNTAELYSWTTFLSYLTDIKRKYYQTLTPLGQKNFNIALREATLLKKANKKAYKVRH